MEQRRALSERAIAFYAQHNVTTTVEKLLNEMFLAEPRDVYGYMSNYFGGLAVAPVISSARCTESVDERGGRAVDVAIHCTVKGVDRFVASASVPFSPHPPPLPSPLPSSTSPSKAGAKKKGGVGVEPAAPDAGREASTAESKGKKDAIYALESFDTYIAPVLLSRPPNQQSDIDNTIIALRDKEGKELHSSALLATSLAVAKSAALLSNIFLYDHLISVLSSSSSSSPISLPTPLTSLLAGGSGKLKVREFCILPLPGRILPEQIFALSSVYGCLGTLLSAKTGAAAACPPTGPRGVYCPPLDRLEAGLDLVKEAVTQASLSLGQDISVLVDIGAERLFDQAVAMQCEILRLGPPCGVTSTCLLSRLLQIRDELSTKGTYEPAKALVFSSTSLSQLAQQEQ